MAKKIERPNPSNTQEAFVMMIEEQRITNKRLGAIVSFVWLLFILLVLCSVVLLVGSMLPY